MNGGGNAGALIEGETEVENMRLHREKGREKSISIDFLTTTQIPQEKRIFSGR